MQVIELVMPIGQDGNVHLPAQYQRMYGQNARFVISLTDVTPPLTIDAHPKDDYPADDWPLLKPARDLARFVGTIPFPEDGVAYQRQIRDSEWP
jgi:hypothetical protein